MLENKTQKMKCIKKWWVNQLIIITWYHFDRLDAWDAKLIALFQYLNWNYSTETNLKETKTWAEQKILKPKHEKAEFVDRNINHK